MTTTILTPRNFPEGVSVGFGTKHVTEEDLRKPAVTMQQVHGNNITYITDAKDTLVLTSDGLVSGLSDITLTVKTADCVPIIFYDPESGLIGISHQGWKGTIEKLPQKMVEMMVHKGARIASLRVAIGPSIGACCYKIFGERRKMFEESFPEHLHRMFVQNGDDIMLNLTYLNYALLLEAGILPVHLEYVNACTSCNDKVYYSYNREKIAHSMYSYIRKNS